MEQRNLMYRTSDRLMMYVYRWISEGNREKKGIVQITHGMAEAAHRYKRFAERLTEDGYIVYAHDQRGHGETAKGLGEIGYIGDDGYNRMVEDMREITGEIRRREGEELPIILFGHSMGSFLTQRYISLYGDNVDGVILSGTSNSPGPAVNIGIRMAKREMDRRGERERSERLNDMSFGSYNKRFSPNRTEFDWLSRDEEEVDKYIADPYCGGIFTTNFYYYFFQGLNETFKRHNLAGIPKDLPIYMFGGDKDPVGKMGRGIPRLVRTYESLGIKDVTYRLYKDGRHEMLNEINRDEVTEDVIAWLDNHIGQ